jgi:competence protein ComEC
MGVAGLIAALAGRPSRRWYALLLAAAVTLGLNPRAVEEPGWQLSFAAVAALLVGAGPLRTALAHRMPEPVADAAAITIAATLGTAPLMAVHFQQVSLAALPANLLAAPAIAPVMWLGVLAGAAAQLAEPLAAPFSVATAPLLVYLQQVAHRTAAAPFAVVEVDLSPVVIVGGWAVLATAVALAVKRGSHRPRRRRRTPAVLAFVAALAVALGAAQSRAASPPDPNTLVISFLDVGQGDATLLQLGGTTGHVDTGRTDGPILERLEQAGVRRLDALMLTHAETDHEGAAPAVIRRFSPRLVVNGGAGWPSAVQRLLARTGAPLHAPAAGEAIAIGALRLRVLWPPPRGPGWRPSGDPNASAVVARLEARGLSMLLAADAESDVTGRLELEPVDVLKVAHHGSADPGLPPLLERLEPRVAAIEVGRRNTYGHPAPSTVAALRATVPTVLRTDRDGTVRVHAARGRVWVERGARG